MPQREECLAWVAWLSFSSETVTTALPPVIAFASSPKSAIRFAIRLLVYHCFSLIFAPSVALHVVEFTFSGGFESYLRSHFFSWI
jgi:hypothetical protein